MTSSDGRRVCLPTEAVSVRRDTGVKCAVALLNTKCELLSFNLHTDASSNTNVRLMQRQVA